MIHLTGAMLEDVFSRHMRNVARRVPPLEWEVEHLTSGVSAKRRLIKQMAAGDAVAARQTWETYIRVYWDRVAQHVGRDSPIEIYSDDNPPPTKVQAVDDDPRVDAEV